MMALVVNGKDSSPTLLELDVPREDAASQLRFCPRGLQRAELPGRMLGATLGGFWGCLHGCWGVRP